MKFRFHLRDFVTIYCLSWVKQNSQKEKKSSYFSHGEETAPIHMSDLPLQERTSKAMVCRHVGNFCSHQLQTSPTPKHTPVKLTVSPIRPHISDTLPGPTTEKRRPSLRGTSWAGRRVRRGEHERWRRDSVRGEYSCTVQHSSAPPLALRCPVRNYSPPLWHAQRIWTQQLFRLWTLDR